MGPIITAGTHVSEAAVDRKAMEVGGEETGKEETDKEDTGKEETSEYRKNARLQLMLRHAFPMEMRLDCKRFMNSIAGVKVEAYVRFEVMLGLGN